MLYIRYTFGKHKPIFICQEIDMKWFLILDYPKKCIRDISIAKPEQNKFSQP
jgi:hypothetical protein